jgi:uncharacterized protein YjbI with pentapeptide repeats
VITHPTSTHFTQCPNAQLVGASLRGANLSYAVLAGAKLNQANLSGANMTRANLTGTSLSGASLTGVSWNATTCPDGTNSDDVGGMCSGPHLSTVAAAVPAQADSGPEVGIAATGFDPAPFIATGSGLIALGLALLQGARIAGRRRLHTSRR